MDVDEPAEKEDYSEAMSDPSFLQVNFRMKRLSNLELTFFPIEQNVLENLPGVDPQSEAVRSAMGAVTGANKDKKDEKKDGDKKEDKDKK